MIDFAKRKIKEIQKAKINAQEAMDELMSERDRIVSEYNALCGAEQAYQEMLAELEKTAELEKGETDEHDKC